DGIRDDLVTGVQTCALPICFTTAIPTSQCIVCHVHPGTNVMNSYLGYIWWDEETDGELMYPAEQKYPTSEEMANGQMSNPDEARSEERRVGREGSRGGVRDR